MANQSPSLLHVLELDGAETKLSIAPGSLHAIVPGLTVLAQDQTKELLLELDRKILTDTVLLGDEKVFAVKPWKPHQVLSIGTRRFICLPHLGSHLYNDRSESQLHAALKAMEDIPAPEFSQLESIPLISLSLKQKGMFTISVLVFGLGAYGLMGKKQQENPVSIKSIAETPFAASSSKPEPLKAEIRESKPQELAKEQLPSLPDTIPAPTAVAAQPKTAKTKAAKTKAAVSEKTEAAPKVNFSPQEVSAIRDLLQRASLEARFDPERARGKMQVLLTRAKGHPGLTQAIRQEMNLIQ